jgi:hypothetical protein
MNPLTGISVQDRTGNNIDLGSLWEEKTVVLVFVRHFG